MNLRPHQVVELVNRRQMKSPIVCPTDGTLLVCELTTDRLAVALACKSCQHRQPVPKDVVDGLDPRKDLLEMVETIPRGGWWRKELRDECFGLAAYLYGAGVSIDTVEFVLRGAFRVASAHHGSEEEA